MSKLLANQIANYNDDGPVEVKEGVNIPTGKPLQAAGGSGTSGQFLKSTGSSVAWETFPSIPAAQVAADWNATTGLSQIINKPNLHPVALSGVYSDLSGTPTIPAPQVQSDWNETSGIGRILNKPSLFTGAYSDLTGRPSIPATITDLSGVNLPYPIPDGSYIQWDQATTKWIVGTGSQGILELKEDTTPQLGGNLDANGKYIDMGNNLISDARVSEWNVAYGWGNHASVGYLTTYTNTTYSQACIGDSVGVKIRLTDSFGTQDDILITAGNGINIGTIGTEGFTISSTGGGGGGGATVTTSEAAPTSPTDGDLWWASNEGRLKVFYDDGSGSVWVDANPPLSPSFTPRVSNQTVELEAFHNGNAGNYSQHYLKMTGHLLPSAHEQYDIGSADAKIRHLFLSDNSVWLGDTVKMSNNDGKVKFYTRDTAKVPALVAAEGGDAAGCITFIGTRFPSRSGVINAGNTAGNGIFLSDWLAYYCSLKNQPEGTYDISDLWPVETLLGGSANTDYNDDDWSNVADLTQTGKKVVPTVADDASEYKLYESNSFLRTSALADFPVKIIGAQAVEGTVVEITIYVPQGNTPRALTTLSIDGTDATQLNITGTPEANTTNTFTIKAIYFGAVWKATVAIG